MINVIDWLVMSLQIYNFFQCDTQNGGRFVLTIVGVEHVQYKFIRIGLWLFFEMIGVASALGGCGAEGELVTPRAVHSKVVIGAKARYIEVIDLRVWKGDGESVIVLRGLPSAKALSGLLVVAH